jgi:cytochrome d ubiquinol oxidase subunit I
MTDIMALLTNPYVAHQYPHTVLAGLVTAAFFVTGISAYHLLRNSHVEVFRKSIQIGLMVGVVAVFLTALTGHTQGQYLVQQQPMKMAAAEAHWETANPAPFNLIASIDEEKQKNTSEIQIPGLLSFLSFNTFSGEVKGIKDLQKQYVAIYGPGNYTPPVAPVFWSFRIMLAAGGALLLLGCYAFYLYRAGTLETKPCVLQALLWSIPLPYIANSSGWMMAEIGRQPWLVVGLQRIEAGISPGVSAGEIWLTLIGFTVVYGVLAIVDLYLLTKYSKQGPVDKTEYAVRDTAQGVSLWN